MNVLRAHSKLSKYLKCHALVVILSLMGCDLGARTEAAFLEAVETEMQAGDYQAAAIELKNLLRSYPQSVEGRWLLGRVQLQLGDAGAASKELRRALDLGKPVSDVAVPLAKALLIENPRNLGTALAVLGDESELPDDVRSELHLARGLALLRTQRPKEASEELSAAASVGGDSPSGQMAEALRAFNEQRFDDARELVARVLEAAPERPEAIALRGDLAMVEGEFQAAAADYKKVIEIEPASAFYHLALAKAQIDGNNPEGGIDTLRPLLRKAPELPYANYLRAAALLKMKDYSQAQDFSERALQGTPEHAQSRYIAALTAYMLGQHERAYGHLKRAESMFGSSGSFRKLLAATQLKLGLVDEAMHTVSAMRQSGSPEDAQFLASLAKASASSTTDLKSAVQWLSEAAETQPDDVAVHLALGVARLESGDDAGSVKSLERALELNPSLPEAEIMSVIAALRRGGHEEALVGAQKIIEKYPERSVGQTLLGIVQSVRGNVEEAKRAFREAMKMNPRDIDAANNLGHILYAEQKWKEAGEAFERVLAEREGNSDLLLKMAVIESRLGRENEALSWLEKAVAVDPDAAAPRIALASVYLRTKRAQDAIDVALEYARENKLPSALREILGNAQLQLEQYREAAATFEPLASSQPENIALQRRLARAYKGAGEVEKALLTLDRALAREPEHEPSLFLRAELLSSLGRLDEAQPIVSRLREGHPDNVELLELEGAIALRGGQVDAAVKAYERAFELRQTNLQVLKLARALMLAGKVAEAEAQLTQWLEKYPDDNLSRKVLADYYLRQDRLAEAETQFVRLLEANPDDNRARNNLAWLMHSSGRHAEALKHAERAHKQDPNNHHVEDTLGQILLAMKSNEDRALSLLRSAARGLPDDRAVQTNLAHALARTGRSQEAIEVLEQVLSDDTTFSNRPQAEDLLRTLSLLR